MADDLEQLGFEFVAKGAKEFESEVQAVIRINADLQRTFSAFQKSMENSYSSYSTTVKQATLAIDRANQARIKSEQDAVTKLAAERRREEQDVEKSAAKVAQAMQRDFDNRAALLKRAERDLQSSIDREKELRQREAADALAAQAKADMPSPTPGPSPSPENNNNALSYLRTLTALNAATNLLGVNTGNAVQEVATLGLAFSQLGKGAGLAAGGVGVVLAGIGSLIGGIEQIKGFVLDLISNLEKGAIALGAIGAAAVGASIKLGSEYATALNKASVFTGATAEQLAGLDKNIEQVSRRTGRDMPMLANTIADVGKAGFSTAEILKGDMLKAITNLTIASSGDLGLADAADVTAKTLRAFSLDSTHTTEVVNTLAGVAQSSVVKFSDLASAMKYVAPQAAALGFTVQDTAAAIGVLGQAGIVGSQAGTNLRQMFVSLEKPTKNAAALMNEYKISLFDASGHARPFRDVLVGLQNAFGDAAVASGKLTAEERNRALVELFTVRGAQAALTLIRQQVGAYDELRAAAEKLTAANLATALLAPLNVQWDILINNIKVSATQLGEGFLPILQMGVGQALGFAAGLGKINLEFVGLAAQAIILQRGFGELQSRLGELELPPEIGVVISKLIDLFLNLRITIAEQIIPAIKEAWQNLNLFGDISLTNVVGEFNDLSQKIRTVGEFAAYAIGGVVDFINNIKASPEAVEFLKNALIGLGVVFIGLPSIVVAVSVAVLSLIGHMVRDVISNVQFLGNAIQIAMNLIGQIWYEGWNYALEVINGFVKGIVGAIPLLAPVLEALGNVPDDVKTSWATGFSNLLRIVTDFVNGVLRGISEAVTALRNNPLFQAAAGLAGAPEWLTGLMNGLGAVGNQISNLGTIASGSGARLGGLFGQIAGIPDVINTITTTAPRAVSQLDFLNGSLTGFMDNIVKNSPAATAGMEELLGLGEGTGAGHTTPAGGGGSGPKGPKDTRSALEGFLADTDSYRTEFGKMGAALAEALNDALVAGVGEKGKAGEKVRSALNTLVGKLKEQGVDDWEYLGDALDGALTAALEAGTPEAVAVAQNLIKDITAAIDEHLVEMKFQKVVDAARLTLTEGFLTASKEMENAVIAANFAVANAVEKSQVKQKLDDQKEAFKNFVDDLKNAFSKLGSTGVDQLDGANEAIKGKVDTLLSTIGDLRQGFVDEVTGLNDDLEAAGNSIKAKLDHIVDIFKAAGKEQKEFDTGEEQIKNDQKRADLRTAHERKLADIRKDAGKDENKKRVEENQRYREALADLEKEITRREEAETRKDEHQKRQAAFKADENTAIAQFNTQLNGILGNFAEQEKLQQQIADIYDKLNTETLPGIQKKFADLTTAEKARYDEQIVKLPIEKDLADAVYNDMVTDLNTVLDDLRKSVVAQHYLYAPPPSTKTVDESKHEHTHTRNVANGVTTSESDTFKDTITTDTTDVSSQSGPLPLGFQIGGIVGHTQQAILHAGEAVIANAQWQHTVDSLAIVAKALTAVAMREVSEPSNRGNVVNNYSYNVAANYTNQQSPASVAMDLNAMIAMAQR